MGTNAPKQISSISSRLIQTHQDKISGRNILISAPVQTADPRNYGGLNVYLAVGVNLNQYFQAIIIGSV